MMRAKTFGDLVRRFSATGISLHRIVYGHDFGD
jgi:hypothetical protein